MSTKKKITLMDIERIKRSLKRMAYEIAERNAAGRSVSLVGLNKRGYVVAQALAEILESISKESIQMMQLRLDKEQDGNLAEQMQDTVVDQPFIIAVDDVIFSGLTMFRALTKISEQLNPTEIYTAVLIDRGHRQFPVQAEFCGMELPTKLDEHVSVIIDDHTIEQIVLTNKENR